MSTDDNYWLRIPEAVVKFLGWYFFTPPFLKFSLNVNMTNKKKNVIFFEHKKRYKKIPLCRGQTRSACRHQIQRMIYPPMQGADKYMSEFLQCELRKVRKEKNSSKRLPATDEPGEES